MKRRIYRDGRVVIVEGKADKAWVERSIETVPELEDLSALGFAGFLRSLEDEEE
jgi:hypothetical protein